MTLAELNACERDAFVNAIGWVYEGSPWVAERAWDRRPFSTLDELQSALTGAIADAGRDEQLALLRAHPDLGARARMSDASSGEQAGAGLDRLTADEFERLQAFNAAYQRKFAFPFLFAVTGSTKHDVIDALETRLSRGADEEFAEALRQVFRIGYLRLHDFIG